MQLSKEQIEKLDGILEACEDHPGFISGDDVAAIAKILKELFAEKPKQAPKKRTQKPAEKSGEDQ